LTVAVNVTGRAVREGLSELVTVVVVASAAFAVVMVRLQPPAIEPRSPLVSSTTKSCHAPLGLIPVNAPARVVCDDGVGAGAGRVSVVPAATLVGRYVPDGTLPLGTVPAAASSKVKVALLAKISASLPASDRTMRFAPVGATTMASTSLSAEWVRPLKATVTLVTAPVIPDTLTDDG